VTILVFFIVRFIPGDVVDQMAAEMATESGYGTELTAQNIRHALGLDVPVHIQYGHWLGGLIHGDLGDSLWKKLPVTQKIMEALPISLELGILALIIALVIAIPIGVFSAIRQDTMGDYVGRTIAILSISLPSFWIGTMVIVYPSVWLSWTPPMVYVPFVKDPIGNLAEFIIPAIILGMVISGTAMRMTRTMMLEVLRQDYIRTAWSKGLRERIVVIRHALRNALVPVITIIGLMMPIVVGGSLIIEQIFSLPGMGRLMIEAITKRDYTMISGINVLVASFVLVVNLAVDLSYAYLNPRIRYG